MNEKKLRLAWIGTLVGAFVLIVAMVLVWKFRFYDNTVSQLNTTNASYATEKANADKLAPTLKSALLAQQRLALAQGELDYFRTRYRSLPFDLTESPVTGQGPRNATWRRYLNEYSSGSGEYVSGFGIEAVRQLKRAADESGVVIKSNIKVSAPPQNPEDVVNPPSGLLKPQDAPLAVSVTGTFGSILNFFQIINRSEILMVIGNVKMAGTSPNITATFTITPYLLVSGPSAQASAIPGIENARPGAAAAAVAPAGGTGESGEPGGLGGPGSTSGPGSTIGPGGPGSQGAQSRSGVPTTSASPAAP